MLAGISGKAIGVEENSIIIECGYFRIRVLCPLPVISNTHIGENIDLCTHFHVREDALMLYGFAEAADLKLFRLLISVSGIGPKGALEILAAGGEAVRNAIIQEDIAFLTSIKGIGKRIAERAIVELREKISLMFEVSPQSTQTGTLSTHDDILSALEGLGWKRNEIMKKLRDAPKSLQDSESVIRWFLTNH